jgi:hypothetical protein
MHSLILFTIYVIESIFLNIVTNGLSTSEHFIVVFADLGGTLKRLYRYKTTLSVLGVIQNN